MACGSHHLNAATGALLESFLGVDLISQTRPLDLAKLYWAERRHYGYDCNWKVFVDNYLDGGVITFHTCTRVWTACWITAGT